MRLHRALWATIGTRSAGTACETEDVPSGTDAMNQDTPQTSRVKPPDTDGPKPLRYAIAQLPMTCRAQALSMPGGHRTGGVEAERRALTALSMVRAHGATRSKETSGEAVESGGPT